MTKVAKQKLSKFRLQNSEAGFSIVEMMIILIVVTTAFLSFVGLFVSIQQTNQRAKRIALADQAAFGKLQEYENQPYYAIPIGDSGSSYEVEDFSSNLDTLLGSDATGKVYSQYADIGGSPSTTLKYLRVVVVYDNGNGNRTVDYSSHIHESGVGR